MRRARSSTGRHRHLGAMVTREGRGARTCLPCSGNRTRKNHSPPERHRTNPAGRRVARRRPQFRFRSTIFRRGKSNPIALPPWPIRNLRAADTSGGAGQCVRQSRVPFLDEAGGRAAAEDGVFRCGHWFFFGQRAQGKHGLDPRRQNAPVGKPAGRRHRVRLRLLRATRNTGAYCRQ